MKLLFIGDIVGKPGRRAVKQLLPGLRVRHGIDVVIANCENAAGGFGVTRDVVDELLQSSIDVLTSGNHIWDKKDVLEFIDDYPLLLRPANYPEGTPGRGSVVADGRESNASLAVINLQGRVFMQSLDCPFKGALREIDGLSRSVPVIIVDIHAEATSEKQALGWFLDGKVSAVIGTHTHVQTADERILPGGTAYLTDAGMTGAFDSVLGVRKEAALERFLTGLPNKFEVAKGNIWLQGVVVEVNEQSGRSSSITRVNEVLE
ncbi:MAG TPA: TIGR00282 family metallophosphoesterase [Deltaproteobacteria bacterium]|nr:TIGR00282 family metallophosphoesterase [Deltaproteobacteria bacterium]